MDRSEMSSWSYTDMKKHTDVGDSFWSFGKEQDFKPHIRHIEPVLTECDLDWKSHLRWIPEPRYSDAPFPHIKDIKFPHERKLMRSFPQANMMSESEWSFYPNFGQPKTYHTGKRCFTDGVNHMRSMRCISENSLESSIGRKKQGKSKCSIYPLKKVRPFLVPEYSPGFHKYESTLRRTTYGPTYAEKRKSRLREEDILEVQSLSSWRPALNI
ncbi:spermatogenesis-associated serine-rich protein 1 [Chanodichthys erythropterus]|uniref:spermatogenesis-associated serine-rich protein 1 n=1 Tax=Chanodichthys erythropterus TaxID=933992 RepID=UPI00351EF2B8